MKFYPQVFTENNALVNLIPHYPPPGLMKGFEKGINERPFPQGGAFDIGLSQVVNDLMQ